jgi:hypothetical protein
MANRRGRRSREGGSGHMLYIQNVQNVQNVQKRYESSTKAMRKRYERTKYKTP